MPFNVWNEIGEGDFSINCWLYVRELNNSALYFFDNGSTFGLIFDENAFPVAYGHGFNRLDPFSEAFTRFNEWL